MCNYIMTVIATMSDLAPFVAASIRDKVVHDLQEEVSRLEAMVQSNRYPLEITGPGGYPT